MLFYFFHNYFIDAFLSFWARLFNEVVDPFDESSLQIDAISLNTSWMVVELKRETIQLFACFLWINWRCSINSGVFFGFHEYIETDASQMALNFSRGFTKAAVQGSSLRNREEKIDNRTTLPRSTSNDITIKRNIPDILNNLEKFYSL